MSELHLSHTNHPYPDAAKQYEALVGIDSLKTALVDELMMILDPARLDAWRRKHHSKGLLILDDTKSKAPLILLHGDVGCGKTALASCVATPVAKAIDQRIISLESPSDIRGRGHVGEVSARITETFSQTKAQVAGIGRGILIIDEADDLATQRSQMQAHHEDRAGVNVLIKEIDKLSKNPNPIAVIIITNRENVLDPAVVRRAVLSLHFSRPNEDARRALFTRILQGTDATLTQIQELVVLTKSAVPYTFSDLTDRVARLALRQSWKNDRPFGFIAIKAAVAQTKPSPLIEAGH
jgi:SpoVK/Ycf46/Vps4 family AAA+-type ATPase